jgi:hypothetical protein
MPDLLEDIKKHIDRRFLELVDKQNYTEPGIKQPEPKIHVSYTVPFFLNFPDLKSKQFLEINPEDTVQTIYNVILSKAKTALRPNNGFIRNSPFGALVKGSS